ncbi:MAG: type II toxin-antitoxin system RelE/ParE family toxin, partial [Gammaproteobacteria bacterium]|nr:type II toxin-antitoxin system RelE/ParE family toxin [Gammaproteobacteria bacterium]
LKNFYSVTVRANWRVIFQFEDQDAVLIDYIDYH